MKRLRLLVLAGLIIALSFTAGCLREPPSEYEGNYTDVWNSSSDITYFVQGEKYRTAIKMNGSESIGLWQEGVERKVPLSMGNLQFRFENGTVVKINETETNSGERIIEVPGPNGTLAYTSPMSAGSFVQPTPKDASVRIVLPEGKDARNFALGEIHPGGYNVTNERPLVLDWDKVKKGKNVRVDYYNRNDPYYLIYLLIGLLVAAIGVLFYYRRVLQDLKEKREEYAMDR